MELSADDEAWLVRALREVHFFSPLTVGEVDQLLKSFQKRQFGKRARVIRKGDFGDFFCIIRSGRLLVWLPRLSFLKKRLATLGEGSYFGESALLSGERRNANVSTLEESELLFLYQADFLDLIDKNPELRHRLKKSMEERRSEQSWSG